MEQDVGLTASGGRRSNRFLNPILHPRRMVELRFDEVGTRNISLRRLSNSSSGFLSRYDLGIFSRLAPEQIELD